MILADAWRMSTTSLVFRSPESSAWEWPAAGFPRMKFPFLPTWRVLAWWQGQQMVRWLAEQRVVSWLT